MGRVHRPSVSAPLAIAGTTTAAAVNRLVPSRPAVTPRIIVRFTTFAFRALAVGLGRAVLGGTLRTDPLDAVDRRGDAHATGVQRARWSPSAATGSQRKNR